MSADSLAKRGYSLLHESVSHAFLMTSFRLDNIRSYCFHVTNYRNWSDDFSIGLLDSHEEDPATLWAYKTRYRWRCRAWAELAVIMSEDAACTDAMVELASTDEISQYLHILLSFSETYRLNITTIEALDALAGAVSFAYFTLRRCSLAQTSAYAHSKSLRDIRQTSTTAADVLTTISQRFTSMVVLREFLRAFTATVEDHFEPRNAAQRTFDVEYGRLQGAIDACGALLPQNLRKLTWKSLDEAARLTLT